MRLCTRYVLLSFCVADALNEGEVNVAHMRKSTISEPRVEESHHAHSDHIATTHSTHGQHVENAVKLHGATTPMHGGAAAGEAVELPHRAGAESAAISHSAEPRADLDALSGSTPLSELNAAFHTSSGNEASPDTNVNDANLPGVGGDHASISDALVEGRAIGPQLPGDMLAQSVDPLGQSGDNPDGIEGIGDGGSSLHTTTDGEGARGDHPTGEAVHHGVTEDHPHGTEDHKDGEANDPKDAHKDHPDDDDDLDRDSHHNKHKSDHGGLSAQDVLMANMAGGGSGFGGGYDSYGGGMGGGYDSYGGGMGGGYDSYGSGMGGGYDSYGSGMGGGYDSYGGGMGGMNGGMDGGMNGGMDGGMGGGMNGGMDGGASGMEGGSAGGMDQSSNESMSGSTSEGKGSNGKEKEALADPIESGGKGRGAEEREGGKEEKGEKEEKDGDDTKDKDTDDAKDGDDAKDDKDGDETKDDADSKDNDDTKDDDGKKDDDDANKTESDTDNQGTEEPASTNESAGNDAEDGPNTSNKRKSSLKGHGSSAAEESEYPESMNGEKKTARKNKIWSEKMESAPTSMDSDAGIADTRGVRPRREAVQQF